MWTRSWALLVVIGIVAIAVGMIAVGTVTKTNSTTIDSPLRLDESADHWPEIQILIGQKAFVELSRRGGTGYLWEAKTEDAKIALVERVTSKIERRGNGPAVGQREIDMFAIAGADAGETRVLFNLRRVNSDPIKTVSVQVSVTQ